MIFDSPKIDETSQKDLTSLQGIWRTVAVETDGTSVASWLFQDARLEIAGDHFALHNPLPDAEQRIEGVLTLDATRFPKHLKLTLERGQVIEEIYVLEENCLKVCYPTVGGKRPFEFKTAPQSGVTLVVYERVSRP